MSHESRSASYPPPRRPRRILCMVGGESPERSRIAGAVRVTSDDLRYAATLNDAGATIAREHAVTVGLLIDVGRNRCSPSEIRAFRAQDAATVLLLVTGSGSRTTHQLAALARAGLDGLFVVDGPDSLETLRGATARHFSNALPWSVVHKVMPIIASDADAILAFCLRHGDQPHHADAIAAWLHWDRKTIWRKLTSANFRPIHDLIDIGRLVHAAARLDERVAPIDMIARNLEIDTSTLRRLCERETGYSPTELRDRGALRTTTMSVRIHRE